MLFAQAGGLGAVKAAPPARRIIRHKSEPARRQPAPNAPVSWDEDFVATPKMDLAEHMQHVRECEQLEDERLHRLQADREKQRQLEAECSAQYRAIAEEAERAAPPSWRKR